MICKKNGKDIETYAYSKILIAVIVILSVCIIGVGITIVIIYNNRKNASLEKPGNSMSEAYPDTIAANESVKEDKNKELSKQEEALENEEDEEQKHINETGRNDVRDDEEDHETNDAKPKTEWEEALIKEVEKIKDEFNDSIDVNFDIVDIDGDDVPELVTFNTEGRFAEISIYKSGKVVTQKLFDNKDRPEGFTDYGAYASIQSKKRQFIKMEYDSTYEKDGGWYKPGAELIYPDGREYEYYEYMTVYEINDNKDIVEKDKYSCHYHYNKMGPEYDEYNDYQEPIFVEADHNGLGISEDEYKEFKETTWSCDVGFGSAQDASYGLSAEQTEKMLNGEKFIFDVYSIHSQDESGDLHVILKYEYPWHDTQIEYDKNILLSDLPSGIKEGDKLYYSLYTGWEKKKE